MLRRTLLLVALVVAVIVIPTWTAPVLKTKAGKEITNSIGMKLVLIPSGKFKMGSSKKEQDPAIRDREKVEGMKASDQVIALYRAEGPQHEVEITQAFYMGVYAVTQKEFKAVMGYNPSFFSQDAKGKPEETYNLKPAGGKDKVPADTSKFPVENIAWEEAQEFCNKLTKHENGTGRKYRLPTEGEWEYACRAGTKTKYHSGDEEEDLKKVAWYSANSNYRTHTVGKKMPNAWGLYDMHGNVFQWCSDWYGKDYYQNRMGKDPIGPGRGDFRVLRGGFSDCSAQECRAAYRFNCEPDSRGSIYEIGFRVVCVPSGK